MVLRVSHLLIVGRVGHTFQKFGEDRRADAIGRMHCVQQRLERTARLLIVGRVGHMFQKF